ncbi:MAG: hypothetical protein QOJ99_2937 [Bryobacterales bacterium]|jgi:hypothetical protein|nr:hypothetical protein [Bryobacterales bacterium]
MTAKPDPDESSRTTESGELITPANKDKCFRQGSNGSAVRARKGQSLANPVQPSTERISPLTAGTVHASNSVFLPSIHLN